MRPPRRSKQEAVSSVMALLWRNGVAAEQADEDREQYLRHVVHGAQSGDRRGAAGSLAQLDRHLVQAELVLHRHHRRLDLRIVVEIVGGEQSDALPVDGAETRSRVGNTLTNDDRDTQREDLDPETAHEGRLVATPVSKARADAEIGLPGQKALKNRRQ